MSAIDKTATLKWLSLAAEATKMAGKALSANRDEWNTANVSAARDIKLRADLEAENLLLNHLKTNSIFPILTEETGWHNDHGMSQETFWIVDPLDGTANYAKNIPLCCTCVALMHHYVPVLGAIYDFTRNEIFLGAPGYGATLNGIDIHVSTTDAKNAAILMTGFPIRRDFSNKAMNRFAGEAAQWKKVRMIGSAALSLAYVAAGRADVYHEEAIMLWDVAAGLAIVEAAGGRTTVLKTADEEPMKVVADNGFVTIKMIDG